MAFKNIKITLIPPDTNYRRNYKGHVTVTIREDNFTVDMDCDREWRESDQDKEWIKDRAVWIGKYYKKNIDSIELLSYGTNYKDEPIYEIKIVLTSSNSCHFYFLDLDEAKMFYKDFDTWLSLK